MVSALILCVGLPLAAGFRAETSMPSIKSALVLRGGAYPPPKAGYHALAAKGVAASSQAIAPNL